MRTVERSPISPEIVEPVAGQIITASGVKNQYQVIVPEIISRYTQGDSIRDIAKTLPVVEEVASKVVRSGAAFLSFAVRSRSEAAKTAWDRDPERKESRLDRMFSEDAKRKRRAGVKSSWDRDQKRKDLLRKRYKAERERRIREALPGKDPILLLRTWREKERDSLEKIANRLGVPRDLVKEYMQDHEIGLQIDLRKK